MCPSCCLQVNIWKRDGGDHHPDHCPRKLVLQLLTVLVSALNIRKHRLSLFSPLPPPPGTFNKSLPALAPRWTRWPPNPNCSDANKPTQDLPLPLTEISLEAAEEEKTRISLVPPEERW